MQHPDEGTIHAWLDGQLSADEAAALEEHTAGCADCAALVAEARGLIAASSRIVSALDVVPGGVIPARPIVRRPWYASTQLRAAAAVLFVAGASMLVFRERDPETLQETASRVLAAPDMKLAEEAPQSAQDGRASAPAMPEPSAKQAQGGGAAKRQSADTRNAASAANQAVDLKETAAASAPVPAESRRPEADAAATAVAPRAAFGEGLSIGPVVVTGVATADEALSDEIKLVRADTTGRVNVTVYQIAQGVEVTLTETIPLPQPTATAMARERRLQAAPPETERRKDSAARVGAAAVTQTTAARPPAARTPAAPVRGELAKTLPTIAITWTDPTSMRTYTLSGPLPRERLQEIRKAIEQKKR